MVRKYLQKVWRDVHSVLLVAVTVSYSYFMRWRYFPIVLRARCCLLTVGTIGLISFSSAADPTRLPNVVFIVADDIGYGDVGPFKIPSSPIPTPNIDRLAAEGMMFTDAHTSSSVCAPSRYSLITGNYPYRGRDAWGVWGFKQPSQILVGQRTVADVMRGAGYHTAFFGKWHLGADYYEKGKDTFYLGGDIAQVDFDRPFENGPLDHGFDYSFVMPSGIQAQPYAYFELDQYVPIDPLQPDMTLVVKGPFNDGWIPVDGYADPSWDSRQSGPTLAEKAVAFIDQHHQQNLAGGTETPFFVYYATPTIHWPFTPPDTFINDTVVKGATGAGAQADMIFELDLEVGAIIEALEDRNLDQDTLIIFTSDNGPHDEIDGHDRTAGLLGTKATMYEGGHRVPFIAKWGDGTDASSMILPGSVSNQLIGVHDWVATMYDLTDQNKPANQALDSMSILPVLLGKQSESEAVRDSMLLQAAHWAAIFVDHSTWRGFRRGDWMLLLNEDETPVELYNLADDLEQTINLTLDPQYEWVVDELVGLYTYARYEHIFAPGTPVYIPGQDTGVYLWKDAFDGPYRLRVSGDGSLAQFDIQILAERAFEAVAPVQLEVDDIFTHQDNTLFLASRVTTWIDGVDFILPLGTAALISVEQDEVADPRQLHVGPSGTPIAPTGFLINANELPSSPSFETGHDLGLFIGHGDMSDVIARWNGDGFSYYAALKLVSSNLLLDVQPVGLESDDFLTEGLFHLYVSGWVSTWWDGVDVSIEPNSTLGIYYEQDGLFQPHLVNPLTRDLGFPNAYTLPIADVGGEPVYEPATEKGLYIWLDEDDTWHLRVTAGGDFGSYTGAIVASAPYDGVTGVSLEANDLLDISSPTQILFDLRVWNQWTDGIDFVFPKGTGITLQFNDNTATATELVNIGGERWPVNQLPVRLQRSTP